MSAKTLAGQVYVRKRKAHHLTGVRRTGGLIHCMSTAFSLNSGEPARRGLGPPHLAICAGTHRVVAGRRLSKVDQMAEPCEVMSSVRRRELPRTWRMEGTIAAKASEALSQSMCPLNATAKNARWPVVTLSFPLIQRRDGGKIDKCVE